MRIFLSYRRSDSAAICDRIYASLVERFGDAVFKDIDSIPLGVDFARYIDQVLAQSGVMLVVIGRNWLRAGPDQLSRLNDPQDMVRLEIEAGLRNGLRVIPITVDGASMPQAADLPESLRSLATRNGWQVHPDPYFETDMGRIIRAIEQLASSEPGAAHAATRSKTKSKKSTTSSKTAKPTVAGLERASDSRVRAAAALAGAGALIVLVALAFHFVYPLIPGQSGAGTNQQTFHGGHGQSTGSTTAGPGGAASPTATYAPQTIVYQANWSQGLAGWQGSSQWKWISDGELGNDGTMPSSGAPSTLIWAPSMSLPRNYSVQAKITFLRIVNQLDPYYYGTTGFGFGIIVRGDGGKNGYEGGVEIVGGRAGCDNTSGQAYIFIVQNDQPNVDQGGCATNQSNYISSADYLVDNQPHTLRIDVYANTITLYIDDHKVLNTSDNTYTSVGQVGLRDINAEINVQSFEVRAL